MSLMSFKFGSNWRWTKYIYEMLHCWIISAAPDLQTFKVDALKQTFPKSWLSMWRLLEAPPQKYVYFIQKEL